MPRHAPLLTTTVDLTPPTAAAAGWRLPKAKEAPVSDSCHNQVLHPPQFVFGLPRTVGGLQEIRAFKGQGAEFFGTAERAIGHRGVGVVRRHHA